MSCNNQWTCPWLQVMTTTWWRRLSPPSKVPCPGCSSQESTPSATTRPLCTGQCSAPSGNPAALQTSSWGPRTHSPTGRHQQPLHDHVCGWWWTFKQYYVVVLQVYCRGWTEALRIETWLPVIEEEILFSSTSTTYHLLLLAGCQFAVGIVILTAQWHLKMWIWWKLGKFLAQFDTEHVFSACGW